ncbi:MAG: DUF5615 family PIN-like protein [Phormidesmis sp.]
MKLWIDAQLPPTLADWLAATFEVEAIALKELELRDAQDVEIFEAAKFKKVAIMTKDSDFIDLAIEQLQQGEAIVEISNY